MPTWDILNKHWIIILLLLPCWYLFREYRCNNTFNLLELSGDDLFICWILLVCFEPNITAIETAFKTAILQTFIAAFQTTIIAAFETANLTTNFTALIPAR
jgi:hypothetical protein